LWDLGSALVNFDLCCQRVKCRVKESPLPLWGCSVVSIRIPDAAVLLVALTVGGLAIYRGNVVIAVVCLSIAALYAAAIVWRRRSRRDRE